jgi:PAS domain S-box-containing protein
MMMMAKQELAIVIVDDNPEDRATYRRYLSQDGHYSYTIWEEESGEKGLELCRKINPDGVLLDFCLPDLDGLQFIQELKSHNRETTPAVIILTGQGNESIAVQAMKSGASDYLIKGKTSPECLRCAVQNATANVKLHRELQQSQERLTLALEAARMGTWEWNIPADEVWLSENFASQYGLTSGSFAETSSAWLQRVHPSDRDSVTYSINYARETKNTYYQEYRLQLDGKIRWVCSQGKLCCDADGNPVRMVGTIQDITIRKQAEEEAQQSHLLIQQIVETTPGFLYVYDLILGRNVYISPQITEMLGYTPAEIQAMGTELFKQLMHPEDYKQLPAYQEQLKQARDGEVLSFEYRMRHKKGEWRWLCDRNKVSKRTPEGLPHLIIGTVQDITERKQTEVALQRSHERFQLATMAVDCMIYDWDINSDTVERTDGLLHKLGYTPQEVVPTGKWWGSLVHPEDVQRVNDNFQASLAVGSSFSNEYRVRHKNGQSYMWVRDMGFIVWDDEGRPLRGVGITIDISELQAALRERKQIESQLQETAERVYIATTAAELGMWFWDIATNQLEWTDKCKELFGLSPDTHISYEMFLEYLHPEDRQRTHAAVTRCLEEKVDYNVEYRVIWGDGSIHWIAAKGRVFDDTEGKPIRMMGIVQEISERKQIEAKLASSQERLELAQKAGKIGVYDWDMVTGVIAWNEQEEEIFGLTLGEFGGSIKHWEEQVYPDDLQPTKHSLQQAIENQIQDWQGEFRILRADSGETRWLEAKGYFVYDESGKPLRMIGTNIDITERKQAEEVIRRSEQQVRRVLNSLFSFVGVLNPDGVLIEVNRTAVEAAALQPEDVLGKPFEQTYWWSYSPEIQAQLLAAIERAAQGEVVRYDVEIRLGEKQFIIIDFGIVPLFNFAGELEYLIPSGIDITERQQMEAALRESEERYRYLTDAIPEMVWTTDADGNSTYINQRWFEYTGLTWEQTVGDDWHKIVHPDDLQGMQEFWQQAVKNGTNFQTEIRYLRAADGTYRWHLIRAFPVRDEHSNIVKWLGTATDIHEQKQLQLERDRLLELEQAANRAKDDFVAMVSHDLRAPLNSILGWAKLLRSGKLDPKTTDKALETIERNAQSQSKLIEDLLDVSRMIQGKLRLICAPVILANVIEVSVEQIRLTAADKQIQLESKIAPAIGLISGDLNRLQQIVSNLLTNAVKFTPKGGRVEVSLQRVGNVAQIQVIDNGKGISPEFLPHIFERFRQEERTTTRSNEGLGLGLAIVHHLVELHGGTIRADSPGEGLGATFTIELPLIAQQPKPADAKTPQQETQSTEIPSASVGLLKGLKVLVVDDEADTRDMLKISLVQEGAKVTTAASVDEALQAMKDIKPDVLISDIGMPGKDGYTLIHKIRALAPHQGGKIPAAAITAFTRESDRTKALAEGFQLHVAKPIEPKQLLEVVANLAGRGNC